MPWGDRTGPLGFGPMTGRGLGYCGGFDSPGFLKAPGWGASRPGFLGWGRALRRRFGWAGGWGRGFRFRFRGGWGWW